MAQTTPWTVNLEEDRGMDLTMLVASTQKLQMSTHIFTLYPYIEWVVDAPLTYLELGTFRIGQGFQFTFNEDRSGSQPSYIFYIDSISYSEMSADSTAPVTFTLILSTGFLFKDRVMDRGYNNNVAGTLKTMFDEELKGSGAIKSLTTTLGLDSPMKRYRTYQNAKDFIETRLASSFRGEKETLTYINTDLECNMLAMDTLRAEDQLTTFYAYHIGYHDLPTVVNLEQDSVVKQNVARFEAMNVSLNSNRELWQISNAGIAMLYRTNTPKILGDFPVFRMFPPMSKGQKGMFPLTSKKRKEYKELTQVYIMDDQNDYSKEYTALSFARNSAIMDAMKITLSIDLNLNMRAGHIMKLYPPSYKVSSPMIASLMEGNWIMTEVSHVFKVVRGRTYVTLQSTALNQRGNIVHDSKYYRQE